MSLSLSEQRQLAKKLTQADRKKIAKLYIEAEQRGQTGSGFFKGLKKHSKKFAKASWPVIKVLGPIVLKEIAVPMIRQYMAGGSYKGGSLNPSGKGLNPSGGALRLAGQRMPKMRYDTVVRRSGNRIRLG